MLILILSLSRDWPFMLMPIYPDSSSATVISRQRLRSRNSWVWSQHQPWLRATIATPILLSISVPTTSSRLPKLIVLTWWLVIVPTGIGARNTTRLIVVSLTMMYWTMPVLQPPSISQPRLIPRVVLILSMVVWAMISSHVICLISVFVPMSHQNLDRVTSAVLSLQFLWPGASIKSLSWNL